MKDIKLKKIVCCSVDLTLATRFIGFTGLAVSLLLVTVLMNDKSLNDYNVSRNVALALGLDWRHFHPHANTAHHADPEGRMLSVIVTFYAIIFLTTNFLLLVASISNKRSLAIPWLLCEFLGCLSKIGALIFHLVWEPENLSNVFLVGSLFYVVIMVWWLVVVFLAQTRWTKRKESVIHLSTLTISSSIAENETIWEELSRENVRKKSFLFESPVPYTPNKKYETI